MEGVNLGRKFSIRVPRRSDEIEVNGGRGLMWPDCEREEATAFCERLGGKVTARVGGMGKLFVRSMVADVGRSDGVGSA